MDFETWVKMERPRTKVKDVFFNRGFFHVGDGEQMRAWQVMWLGNSP
jgi:hypothetical protein